jgi:integrase/recombinase XerD
MYDDLLKGFKAYISLEKNLSNNTALSYYRDVKAFLKWCDENLVNFATITHQILEKYLLYLKEKGYKINSIFRKTESIKAFYKYLFVEKRIESNPLSNFRAPKPERKLPEFLNFNEMEELLSAEFNKDKFNGIRLIAVIDLLYSTGIRVSELCNLLIENVDLNDLWIRVYGKGGKERIVPISKKTAEVLRVYIEIRNNYFEKKQIQPSSYLFLNRNGQRISRISIWKDIKKISRLVGIDKNVYPHIFRHSFATHLLQNGADIRSIGEMLGHSSLSTTQIYTHLDNSAIKDMHKRFHPKG